MKGMRIMSYYKVTRKYSFLTALLLIVVTQVFAIPPRPINYQGYLAQPDGTPIDTSVAVTVELWTAATAGTLLYSESHVSVTVSRGRFSIEIGTGTPVSGVFDADQFRQDTWLALTINGELLNPRSRLGAVAGSQHAEIAERLSKSCADGEWLGFRGGVLDCYECSVGSYTSGCYEGDPATKDVGVCRSGRNLCIEGAYSSACTSQVFPTAESCNSKDDDCNGLVDDGTSLPGCSNAYADADSDGSGAALLGCFCAPPVDSTSDGGDCDDTDSEVKPGQLSYFTLPSNSGSYDYNCNSVIEKEFANEIVASCTYNGSSCDYVPGLIQIPDCGVTTQYSGGCQRSGTVCTVTGSGIPLTMGCR
jgi:hypothetical protein